MLKYECLSLSTEFGYQTESKSLAFHFSLVFLLVPILDYKFYFHQMKGAKIIKNCNSNPFIKKANLVLQRVLQKVESTT